MEEDIPDLLHYYLVREGYVVTTATNGKEVINALVEGRIARRASEVPV